MVHFSAIAESVLQESFLYILNRTVGGAFVILAVILARLLLRRAPRWISFILWAAVALRLLLPFTIEVDRSPVPVTAQPVPVNIGLMVTPEIDTGLDFIDEPVNGSLPAPVDPAYSVNPMQIAVFAGAVLWAAGVCVVLLADGISLLRLRRRLTGAIRLSDGVWMADNLPAPFVWGIVRPRIYIPTGTPESAIPYIVRHEQAHIRRLDPLWKGIGCVTLALHWFNPLCWLGFALFVSDMEAACDEAVLRSAGEDIRADYSEALLCCSSGGRFAPIFPPSFGETDPKARIKSVLKYKKASRAVVILAVIAAAAVCIGCAFSQKSEGEVTNPGAETTDTADSADTSDTAEIPDTTEAPASPTAYAVTFPAYGDIRNPTWLQMCEDTAPFTVTLTLPEGWSVGAPENFDGLFASPVTTLLSPVCFFLNGELVGSMGFYPITNDISQMPPEREYWLACHPLMMGNYSHWDNDYTEVKADGTYKVGTCRISRRADLLDSGALAGSAGAAMETFYFPAIAAYDTELGICLGIELDESAVTDEQWRSIAESVIITAGGERTEWQIPATQSAQITFPAYQGGKDEYNASIYETPAFRLEMQIPLGWRMSIPAPDAQRASLPFTPVTFRYGTVTAGDVGFMTFELYEGITPEDEGFYRMVYNQLMAGNLVTWDVKYTPVESTRTDTFCAATSYVSAPIPVEGTPAAGWARTESRAILAYDTEMLVYVAMTFTDEAGLTDEIWQAMAESIRLVPAE